MPDVKHADPAIEQLENSLLPAFAVIWEHGISFQDAMRVYRRKVVREMVKKTGNRHRASLKLAVSHNWLSRVADEGEGADPISKTRPKKSAESHQ